MGYCINTCGTTADFLKAFDNVNHEMLLKKLEACRVRGLPLKWFSSYLMNRQQYTTKGNTELPMQSMRNTPGEHTGTTSVFHLYKRSDKLSFKISAHDSCVFASAYNLKTLEALN